MSLFSKKKETGQDEPKEKTVAEKPKSPEAKEPKKDGAYFVSTHPDGWQVKRAGAKKALKVFKTKEEAEKYAKQVASNQGVSVIRKKKDGTIQKKRRSAEVRSPSGPPVG